MLAILATDTGAVLRADHPAPALVAGGARLRVLRAGICATDLAILGGYAGFRGVLGHELVGLVEAVASPNDAVWLGRRVVPSINLGCGTCDACAAGVREHCPRRRALGIRGHDGGFATHLVVPVANLHPVPDRVPDDHAVFAEPLAAALRIGQQVPVAGRDAVVVGAGKLGLLIAQALRHLGAKVELVVRRAAALRRVDALGLTPRQPGELAPCTRSLVVDASGTADGLTLALELLAPRGTLVLKSTLPAGSALPLGRLVVDELTLVGSRCGPIPEALAVLAAGAVRVGPLIEATYPLAAGLDALAHAARPGALKVLLAP